MSLISEFRATEEAIKELQERLKALQQDEKLQKEIEFEKKLRDLMGQYGKSLLDIIAILDPASAQQRTSRGAGRSAPVVKRRSEEHTSELQSRPHLVCRLLLEKKK